MLMLLQDDVYRFISCSYEWRFVKREREQKKTEQDSEPKHPKIKSLPSLI